MKKTVKREIKMKTIEESGERRREELSSRTTQIDKKVERCLHENNERHQSKKDMQDFKITRAIWYHLQ